MSPEERFELLADIFAAAYLRIRMEDIRKEIYEAESRLWVLPTQTGRKIGYGGKAACVSRWGYYFHQMPVAATALPNGEFGLIAE